VGSKEIKQQLATNSRRRGDRDWGRPEGDRITHRSWIHVAGAVLVAGEQGRSTSPASRDGCSSPAGGGRRAGTARCGSAGVRRAAG